jgi:very-short-patch-repair endonuclease
VHGYYPDFYCHRHELIVEVDGGIHDLQEEYDAEREEHLRSLGFRIIRFANEEIQKDLKGVLQRIVQACEK